MKQSIKKRIIKKMFFWWIEKFTIKSKKELGIKCNTKLILDLNRTENYTDYKEYGYICVGLGEYNLERLTRHDRICIKNTIYHELIHIRNREYADKQVRLKLEDLSENNGRSIGRMGYKIFDEYIAYKEANACFKEDVRDLRSNSEDIVYVIYSHMTSDLRWDKELKDMTEEDWRKVYDCCYDNLSAIIAYYVIAGSFEEAECLNKAMDSLRELHTEQQNLKWDDYEKIAQVFIGTIICELPSNKQKLFWRNTGILQKS